VFSFKAVRQTSAGSLSWTTSFPAAFFLVLFPLSRRRLIQPLVFPAGRRPSFFHWTTSLQTSLVHRTDGGPLFPAAFPRFALLPSENGKPLWPILKGVPPSFDPALSRFTFHPLPRRFFFPLFCSRGVAAQTLRETCAQRMSLLFLLKTVRVVSSHRLRDRLEVFFIDQRSPFPTCFVFPLDTAPPLDNEKDLTPCGHADFFSSSWRQRRDLFPPLLLSFFRRTTR